MKHKNRLVALVIVLIASVLLAAAAPAGRFKLFRVPTNGSDPRKITSGSDGNMWFTESNINVSQIGRIDAAGNITEFVVPTRFSQPDDIVSGPQAARRVRRRHEEMRWFMAIPSSRYGSSAPSRAG